MMSEPYWTPPDRLVLRLWVFRKAAQCLSSLPRLILSELLHLCSMAHTRGGRGLLIIRAASPASEWTAFWRHSRRTGVVRPSRWTYGVQASSATSPTNSGEGLI